MGLSRLHILAVLMLVLAVSAEARSEEVHWTTRDLLADFFPKAEKVTYEKIELSADELDAVEGQLGYRPTRKVWTIFIALSRGKRIGYAVLDEEIGLHEPITFGVQLDPRGVIQRIEVMVYREPQGGEVTAKGFREQFVGRSWHDPLTLGQDIVAISGATLSSRSLGVGARRVSAVVSAFARREPAK